MAQADQHYTLTWLFFGFSGRIRRATYMLSNVMFVALYSYIIVQIMQTPESSWKFSAWGLVLLAALIITAWASVALSFKRLHDMGFSGFLAVAMFIPMVSFMFFVALCVWPGQPGPNKFGASPLPGRD